ncbi:MAG TPA: hypothetical protein VGN98_15805, partial [Tianweitania sediminis]|nr:hypothetical protein [Tianweitania sediminis]
NTAGLKVGAGATALISQVGSNLTTGTPDAPMVVGAGSNVSYMINGSNAVTSTGASVTSNAAAVQIIQTQNAGF